MATKVLVVEDEPDIRDLIVFHLEREGFRVRSARSGTDALRQIKAAPPDLIVLDLMLPELDGLEVCRRLRQHPSTARVWGYARAGEIESRTVDVHVRRLRQKLGPEGRRILTVKSVGYRFDEDA